MSFEALKKAKINRIILDILQTGQNPKETIVGALPRSIWADHGFLECFTVSGFLLKARVSRQPLGQQHTGFCAPKWYSSLPACRLRRLELLLWVDMLYWIVRREGRNEQNNMDRTKKISFTYLVNHCKV